MQVLEVQELPDILLWIPRCDFTELFGSNIEVRKVTWAEDVR
jgi:hypothetical protein